MIVHLEALLLPLLIVLIAGLAWSVEQQLRWWKRTRGVEAGVPLSKCRSAAQGYVRLFGTQWYVGGQPLLAPMTGKPCTWWSYTIERHVTWRLDKTAPEWKVVKQATSASPLLLDDGTGQVVVEIAGSERLADARDRWYGEAAWPVWPPSLFPGGHKYRYTEKRMDEGDTLYVAGQLTTHSTVPSAAGIKQAALRLLGRWKQDQPALLERFDRNQDGVVDPGEWGTARQAAFAQAEREQSREQDFAPEGRSVISKPRDGKPFVVSPVLDLEPGEFPNPSRPSPFWLVAFLMGVVWCVKEFAS
ncbi:hypothetical protein ACFWZ3_10750 [Frateuria sp. GZRR35]|uniref:hypothetical protein n=1 Tax=Frateuria sp. GZRR35 TaxID=3351536 RepID=UPI003EDBF916